MEFLDISGTEVTDLSPLTPLARLEHLVIQETKVTDFTPLAALPRLYRMGVGTVYGEEAIGRLETLREQMPQLMIEGGFSYEERQLPGDERQAPDALTALRQLDEMGARIEQVGNDEFAIELRFTRDIAEMQPLMAAVPTLRHLSIADSEVVDDDLALLGELTQLQTLVLNETDITDLAPLAQLTNLQTLVLVDAPVADLAALSNLTSLQRLELTDTRVGDATPLGGLPALAELVVVGSPLRSIEPLARCPQLRSLRVVDTRVEDLSPLADFPSLVAVSLGGNSISDLSPLAEMPNLVVLDLRSLQVEDISVLAELEHLQRLALIDYPLTSLGAAGRYAPRDALEPGSHAGKRSQQPGPPGTTAVARLGVHALCRFPASSHRW